MISLVSRFYLSKTFLQKMAPFGTRASYDKTSLEHILPRNESLTSEAKTREFCKSYLHMPMNEKLNVLKDLALKHDLDIRNIQKSAESFLSLHDKGIALQLKAAERLKTSLNPSYSTLFNQIQKLDGGVKFLVDLRADLLNMLPNSNFNDDATPHLKALNAYLKEILLFLFNVGFLQLERITWSSSCYMLEKISEYEAVHPIRSWTDIKQRVGPCRRCYVFTHSSMPNEPIVVLHTALTNEISSNIASIVRQNKIQEKACVSSRSLESQIENPNNIQAAVFYSITSTQKGLHGIELGNQLIKKVVKEVLIEYPNIKQFSSLSPIPGFREWLLLEIRKINKDNSAVLSLFFTEQEKNDLKKFLNCESFDLWNSLHQVLISNRWISEVELKEVLKTALMKMCAYYLYNMKRRSNALNSVAHFHLRNGAVLWRLNWEADLSPRGLDNSCGIMVNYRYYTDETEKNSKNYIENHHIATSNEVKEWLVPIISKACL